MRLPGVRVGSDPADLVRQLPAATSASVTVSSTARRLPRTAIQTSRSGSATPAYSTCSGRSPRTFAIGPSTARITSASVISAGSFASQ